MPGPSTEDRYRVDTPERIELEYDVASLGSRLLAALVDSTIVTLLGVLVMVLGTLGVASALGAFLGLMRITVGGSAAGFWALAVSLLLTFGVIWGYHVFFELIWHGQSPGKRWVGLRVIKEGGYPIGFVDSAIRNLIRLVDFLPFWYIVGAMVMFVDGRSRRLGDLAAGTLVVKERRDLRLDALGVGPAPRPSASGPTPSEGPAASEALEQLSRLTPSDRVLLREYLLRRSSFKGAQAEALARRLATAFSQKLGHNLGVERPESFLNRLARQLGIQQ